MPYPSEHACRLVQPKDGAPTRRNNGAQKHNGKPYDVIFQEQDGKWVEQAFRYPKDSWSSSEASAHCASHDGTFEAAAVKEGETMETNELKDEGFIGFEDGAQPECKAMSLKEFTLDEKGVFKALFAPFNAIDKGGDFTLPGAFGKQNVVISSYGHGSTLDGRLPVGKGVIYDGDEGGIVEGKFFLNTIGGKDTYDTVKELGDLQQWSYWLPTVESEMGVKEGKRVRILKKIKVGEVSPVLRGMGNGTRTLSIKGVPFVEEMERMMVSAENVYDRLKGRVDDRLTVLRNPSASDLKRAREMKGRLEDIARKLGDIVTRHDAFSEALTQFQKITGGNNDGTN
jgi:hypothetical protein